MECAFGRVALRAAALFLIVFAAASDRSFAASGSPTPTPALAPLNTGRDAPAAAPGSGGGCPCHSHRPLALPAACLATDGDSIRALRVRIDHNPHDDAARSRLLDLPLDRPLAKESEPYHEARHLLPPRFTELQTRRFIILSDASPEWTRAQAERLERAHHQFMRFCARLGLEPLPLEHKLVCVLFERREEYRRFAAQHDDVRDEWVAGYYSPRHDRIVFYNVESDPQVERARSKLEEMERELGEYDRRAARHASAGRTQHAQLVRHNLALYERHIARERDRVDAFTRHVAIATTIHEAIHQLAFHTRVQSPHVQNPLWISEGLATVFETDAPGQAFGPDHEYRPRRTAFGELLAGDKLLPLPELIGLSNLSGADERKIRTFYHQSYALVTWMSRFRRAEVREYLNLLRQEKAGPIDRKRQIELFTEAFGDVASLERAWLRHEHAQRAEARPAAGDEQEAAALAIFRADQSAPALSSAVPIE